MTLEIKKRQDNSESTARRLVRIAAHLAALAALAAAIAGHRLNETESRGENP